MEPFGWQNKRGRPEGRPSVPSSQEGKGMGAILLAGLLHGQHDGVDANPDLGKALWRQIDPLAAPAGPEARRPCAKLDMRRRFVDLGRGGQDRAQRAPRFL